MRKTIAILLAAAILTACTAAVPQPVDTDPQTDTTAPETQTAAAEEPETVVETEPDEPAAAAEVSYRHIVTWESSTGAIWCTAVVEATNTGSTPVSLSSCTLDIERADGTLADTLELGGAVPEVIDPGEVGYYVYTGTLDAALPEEYTLLPHASYEEHAAPVRYPVTEITLTDTDYYGVQATCRVANDTDEGITSPHVSVILLGEDGHAVAKLHTYADTIAPGDKVGVKCGALSMYPDITADTVSGYVAVAEPMFQW